MKRLTVPLLLAGILVFGSIIRVIGVDRDLPYVYHPDEPVSVGVSQQMFRNGDPNPHFFVYPSLFLYLNSAVYLPYYAVGKFVGTFHHRADVLPLVEVGMGVTRAPYPSYMLLGRMLTIIFGVATIALIFAVGWRLTNEGYLGLVASAIYATLPTSVDHSRHISPDTFVTFFTVASLLAATLIYREGRMWQYIAAGLLVGLAASSKYTGALALIVVLTAHFLRNWKEGFSWKAIYIAGLFCVIGFLLGTPFALLDFSSFWAGVREDGQHYSTGHPGMQGDALRWYTQYMWQTAGVVYALALLEIIRGVYGRAKETVLLSTFPALYFSFICAFEVRNDRTLLPLTPFACLLASSLLVHLWRRARHLRASTPRRIALAGVALIAGLGVIQPAANTITTTRQLAGRDSRETARVWIENNLPSGSRIAIESYAPFVEPGAFSVTWFWNMIAHEPNWYVGNGFDYLVFSEGMYGRFYRERDRYPDEVSKYEEFFRRFTPAKIFADGNYEVRIYKIR